MFNERIKKLRTSLGYTQKELSELLSISHQAYSKYENGITEPSIETISKLSEIFKVSIDYLLGNEENKKTPSNEGVRINVLGSVPAGIPLEAIEDIVDWEEIPSEWLKKGEYFALRLKGDSMFPKYLDGDTVIFKKQNDCDSGQNALVYVNGYDATFKKVIKKEDGTYVLQPLNNEYEPMIVDKDETFAIVGIPVEIRRKENL